MGKTLLLADDSVTIQKVVGISFASEDIAIVTVDNGDDAITKARELQPDVILADVVMPGMSGYEVCQAVKSDPALAHIPVLLLTGTFEAFDEEHAAGVGAAGHISKPFEAQTLVERVKELLANAQSPAPPPQPSVAAPILEAESADLATAAPDPNQSFDFFEDTGDDLSLSGAPLAGRGTPAGGTTPNPGDSLGLGGGDAFAFEDDDLSAPLEPVSPAAPDPDPASDTSVGMAPPAADPAATVVDTSFLGPSAAHQAVPEPRGLAFGRPETAQPGSPAPAAGLDPEVHDSLAISSSDLLAAESAEDDVSPHGGQSSVDAVSAPGASADPLLSLDALPPTGDLPEIGAEPLDADMDFATPLDANPLESTASGLDTSFGAPAREPLSPSPSAAAVAPPQAPPRPAPRANAPLQEGPAAPASEVPVEAVPGAAVPVSIDAVPAPTEATPAEPLAMPETFATPEPLDAPEPPSPLQGDEAVADHTAALVDRVVEQVTPGLSQELHQTLERVAWESFGAVTEQLVAQAVERIETIAWEVVPKLAETLIQEEIRKLKADGPR